jgi:hypothetical protein
LRLIADTRNPLGVMLRVPNPKTRLQKEAHGDVDIGLFAT